MRTRRPALLFVAALCLAGCAQDPSTDALGRYASDPSGAADGTPLASLPAAAGRVVSVRRSVFANGLSQEIVLDGPRQMAGENLIVVGALTSAHAAGPGDELKLGPPSDETIDAELRSRVPGVAMSVAQTTDRDAFGPFGYATGTSGRLACIYAWQYVPAAHPLTLIEGATGTGELPMSIRVRLCGATTAAVLLDEVRGLSSASAGPTDVAAPGRQAGNVDALAAAVGAPVSSPAPVDGSDAPGAVPVASGPSPAIARAPSTMPEAPSRRPRRRRPVAARRARRPAVLARVAARREERREPSLQHLPRLPLPGDVESPTAPAAAAAPAVAATPAGSGDLPLPR